jgi:hypothetical protein
MREVMRILRRLLPDVIVAHTTPAAIALQEPHDPVADTASAAAVPRAGEFLGVLAQHSFDGADPGRQTRSAQMNCPHLAKPFRGLARAEGTLLW